MCFCYIWYLLYFFFFFSSRRRHTRLTCDWSSDVCSSDLGGWNRSVACGRTGPAPAGYDAAPPRPARARTRPQPPGPRSEERRVGKECRSRGWRDALKKKEKHRDSEAEDM